MIISPGLSHLTTASPDNMSALLESTGFSLIVGIFHPVLLVTSHLSSSLLPETSILSLVTVSLTVLVSVTGFFFTTTSSLTNGFLVTSTSSLFNSTLISVFDFTGPSGDKEFLAGLLSTTISSWVTGTSIVFFSATGSFVIVY